MTAPLPVSLLAAIIGISADAIICVGRDQTIKFFNDGAERMFGYASEEVLGQPLEMLLPAAAHAQHRHHVEGFVRSPVPARRMGERQEIAGRRKNGEIFPAEGAIAKLEADGEVLASVVLRDITKRRRAEVRQQFLVDTSEQLASSLALGATLELTARLWIPTFADLTVVEMEYRGELYHLRAVRGANGEPPHSEPASVIPGHCAPPPAAGPSVAEPVVMVPVALALDAIPPAHRAEVEALAPNSALMASLIHRGEAFGRITAFSTRTQLFDAGDLVLAEDLARRATVALENARLHDQLQRALRARDETVSVVSHDLRNPVNAVKMLAGALLHPGNVNRIPEDVREQIGVVRSAAQQMDTLIQDLLDMSRAEAGRFAVDVLVVPPAALLQDALRTLAPLADDKGVTIVTEWAEGLPDVQVDPERIAQVVSNVVGNAIKFTPTGGTIRISAATCADGVVVVVTDTGPGIAADHLPHVFDRYWQSSRRNRGAGLGLPIAKTIIEAHGGRIWAESTEGGGAAFHFTLPV